MQCVQVCETFTSIQGESTYAGTPCFFIRLSGCNLRCIYCDTTKAWTAGRAVAIGQLVDECADTDTSLVEITGGEPLLQPNFTALMSALQARLPKRTILIETNGSLDITPIPADVVTIMDMKCPTSGESEQMDFDNLGRLKSQDEVKFVLANRADYEWARKVVIGNGLSARCHAVLFSTVHDHLEPGVVANWILEDGLPVRLQIQLHKLLKLP